MIIAGASAYARDFDYARMKTIAGSVGAYLMSDMAHIRWFSNEYVHGCVQFAAHSSCFHDVSECHYDVLCNILSLLLSRFVLLCVSRGSGGGGVKDNDDTKPRQLLFNPKSYVDASFEYLP